MQNTAKVYGARAQGCWKKDDNGIRSFEIFYLSVARSPRAIVSPSSPNVLLLFPSWSLCFSSSRSSVIPYALVTFHENVYSLYVRHSDVLGLFPVFLSFVLVSNIIRIRVICNFLGTPMCRPSRLFYYLLSTWQEVFENLKIKYWFMQRIRICIILEINRICFEIKCINSALVIIICLKCYKNQCTW